MMCPLINQSIIVWTTKTKSLLPSLYPPGQRSLWVGDKREEFPLFGKEGCGEIFIRICFLNYGLLSHSQESDFIINYNIEYPMGRDAGEETEREDN